MIELVYSHDTDPKNLKLCKNCTYSKRSNADLWYFTIPLIGWIVLIIKLVDGTFRKHLCMFSSEKDLVTGELESPDPCYRERMSSGGCMREGKNYVPKTSPLKNVDGKIIMNEVLDRGLLDVIKDYRRESD